VKNQNFPTETLKEWRKTESKTTLLCEGWDHTVYMWKNVSLGSDHALWDLERFVYMKPKHCETIVTIIIIKLINN